MSVSTGRSRLIQLIESPRFQVAITTVIVINAFALGLTTTAWGRGRGELLLTLVDQVCLAIFVVELSLKFVAHGRRFFTSGWNVFDFAVVAVAFIPGADSLTVLRALRALRILRLVSAVPQLRFIVGALASALPGMASIGALLALIFYIGAVMATTMFRATFPEWFGSLGASAYTLFQIMTLESWSMGIVRPVMAEHPWAWAFFIPFILISAFTVLNLFIAVIVDSMNEIRAHDESHLLSDHEDHHGDEQPTLASLHASIAALEARIGELTAALVRPTSPTEAAANDTVPARSGLDQ